MEQAKAVPWDYSRFGKPGATPASPDETIEITIVKRNAAARRIQPVDPQWRRFLDGRHEAAYTVHAGPALPAEISQRQRRHPSAASAPAQLRVTRIGGKPTAGVIKDVVMLGGFQEAEFDFVADNPGPTLFHCHQQLHMDFGFMMLFDYV